MDGWMVDGWMDGWMTKQNEYSQSFFFIRNTYFLFTFFLKNC